MCNKYIKKVNIRHTFQYTVYMSRMLLCFLVSVFIDAVTYTVTLFCGKIPTLHMAVHNHGYTKYKQ